LPHECFVDNKALRRFFHVIGIDEISSLFDGNTQCPKISWHYASNDGEQFLAGLGGRAALDVHPGSETGAAEGLEDHRTGRADSRQMLDLLDRAAEKLGALRNFLITGRGYGNAEGEQVGGIEAGIQCFKTNQAAKQ
jgi:hypothetical protein